MSSIDDTEATSERDPVELLAEEYASRCRDGEAPTIEEYAARYPDLASEIRLLFPAVAFLERGKKSPAADVTLGWASSASSATSGLPYQQLGENRIVRELGRGGMGVVYEAVQEPLGRRVAVKVMHHQAHGDATSRQRFLREARLVARLRHPNIVPIHSVGEHAGIPYFVMTCIDGCGLDRLPTGPASPRPESPGDRARWVANLGSQAATALAHAHDQQVLHRDIKPGNLLLDVTGALWLTDFGLAKLADDLSLTATGDVPGTLRYLAPECLKSEADERSDIYSLGLTLYELLVGRPAFLEMDRIRLLHQIESQIIPAPRKLDREIPRDLETIVMKATARDPSARYQSARELAEDLQRFLEGRPIRARRASAAEQLIRWSRRNRLVASLAATSIVLAVIAAVFFGFYLMGPPHPPRDRRFPPPWGEPPPEHKRWRPEFGPPPPPPPPPHRRHPDGPPPKKAPPPRVFDDGG